MSNSSNPINLGSLFQAVAGLMAKNQGSLNEADTQNHDHGDNMVEVFDLVSKALGTKTNAKPADQLAYASQQLKQKSSGSAKAYADGFSRAAMEMQGQKTVTPENATTLIRALMGVGAAVAGQPSQGTTGNPLGSLPGSEQTASGQGVADLLGSLLGSTGAAQTNQAGQQTPGKFDAEDLLSAGMTYMNTKSQGGSDLQAIVNAIVSASSMGTSAHRTQSSALVVSSLLQALSSLTGKQV